VKAPILRLQLDRSAGSGLQAYNCIARMMIGRPCNIRTASSIFGTYQFKPCGKPEICLLYEGILSEPEYFLDAAALPANAGSWYENFEVRAGDPQIEMQAPQRCCFC
jgi:hypothetical protein